MNRRSVPAPPRRAPLVAAIAALVTLAAPVAARVPAFDPPRPVVRTLDNGLTVMVVPQPHVRLVQIHLTIPAGSAHDPYGRDGLAALTAQAVRRGTTSRSADDVTADVERLGGTLSSSATRELSVLSGSFLAGDLAAGLDLMGDVAIDPRFDDAEVRRSAAQMWRAVAQARMSPAAIADEQVWSLAMRGHPFAHPTLGTPRSLPALDRDAVRGFHRDFWRPDRAVLAIAGDVDPEQALAAAREAFGRWAGRTAETRPLAAPAVPGATRVGLVDLPGVSRAELRVALPVPGRRAGEQAALTLAAAAFAGSADSRLSARVRGWKDAGTPRGGLSLLREGGLLVIGLSVPADSAGAYALRLRDALRDFAEHPPSEAQLAALRRPLANSFPMGFETLGGTLGMWQTARFDGVSDDSLLATPARLAAVRAADVAAIARRWFEPRRAVFLVAGPAARARGALAALGAVEDLRLEDLAAAAAGGDTLATATPERAAAGRAAVRRALEAHGGLARLARIRDSRVAGDMVVRVGGRELRATFVQVRKEPYRMYSISRMLTARTLQVLDGMRAWSQEDPEVPGAEIDSAGVLGLRASFASDLPHLLLAAADSAATVVLRGPDRVGDAATEAVDVVTAQGERRRYHIDAASGRLVALDVFDSAAPVSARLTRRTYSGFQTVDGVVWPFAEERRTPEDNSVRVEVQSVRLDTGVSDGLFYRPVPGVIQEP